MKIAQICPYDIDRPGGVQIHILDTARAFIELGHEVVIIAPGNGRPARETHPSGAIIERIGGAIKIGFGETSYELSLARGAERQRLKRLMQSSHIDVAHFHTVWTPCLAPQALSFYRGPAVATFHDTTAMTLSGRLLRFIFRRVSKRLRKRFGVVITPSRAPQENHPDAESFRIVPPCTDLSRFAASAEPVARLRDGKINLLFLGRLEARKGAMVLLKAFHKAQSNDTPLRLIVAGSGSEENSLREYVGAHAVQDVEFVGAPGDTRPWFATSDIFCAPSLQGESFGIVLAEAMASGKPVIAAANAGYRNLLTGEAAQFLVPPGDSAALAEAIAKLAKDKDLRDRLSAWGIAEAQKYDCRVWAPRLIELYREAQER